VTEESAPDVRREPPDHHVYRAVMFERDTFESFLTAIQFYEERLAEDIRSVQADPELAALLDQETLESYPIGGELNRTTRVRESLKQHLERAGTRPGARSHFVDISLPHEIVRFLKSVALLYLEHLRRKRDVIASRPTTSKALLEALDQQLANFHEKIGKGVFNRATPYPLVIDQLPPVTADTEATKRPAALPEERAPRPRAVVLDTIEIRDTELRRRCLDLLAQFQQDGQHDRLDTVVSEATRILEARLRVLAAADASCSGVDLAAFAFRPPSPRLNVSDVAAEQDAAHLLYRGVFGFVRNSAHHRLLGELQPERVLQIVGMIDYLISVAEAARRDVPGGD
jgi:hypothetical protein